MTISIAGVIVILALLGLGSFFGSPIAIGLFGSLAFAATAIVSLSAGGSSPHSAAISNRGTLSVIAAIVVGAAILVLVVANASIVQPFRELINSMVFEKYASPSGVERAYWNAKSLQAFVDSAGLGIGMGSSRSSSWVISVLSQLGVLGALMMGALVALLILECTVATGAPIPKPSFWRRALAPRPSARFSRRAWPAAEPIPAFSLLPGTGDRDFLP